MVKKSVAVLAVLAVLLAGIPGAASAAAPAEPALVLPEGIVLDDTELAEVEGALVKAMLVGALAGFGGYAAGQIYDWIVHDEWNWSWAEAGKAAVAGATAGAIGKFFR